MNKLLEIYSNKTDEELLSILYLGEKSKDLQYTDEAVATIKKILHQRGISDTDKYVENNINIIRNKKYIKKCTALLSDAVNPEGGNEYIKYTQDIIDATKAVLIDKFGIKSPSYKDVINFMEELKTVHKKTYTRYLIKSFIILMLIIASGYTYNMIRDNKLDNLSGSIIIIVFLILVVKNCFDIFTGK